MKQQKSGRSVRLVGGPFGGKRMDVSDAGANEIIIRGQKRLTRKQRYEMMRNDPFFYNNYGRVPIVMARYQLSIRPHVNQDYMANLPCMHPDGSLFYEFTGEKKEF